MSAHDAALAKARKQARLPRGMFLLPSLFTAMNIGAGYFCDYPDHRTPSAIERERAHTHLDWAAIAILLAIPFDSLDGRIARMTNTASDFGKELDSLADVITFGVAPSLLAFVWGFHFLARNDQSAVAALCHRRARFLCFLFLHRRSFAAGAIQHQPRSAAAQSRPAGPEILRGHADSRSGGPAGSHGAFFQWHSRARPGGLRLSGWSVVGSAGFLMVSTWRFWSGKEINSRRSHPFQILLLLAIVLYVMIRFSQVVLFAMRAALHVLRHLGARGLFLVAPAAQRRPSDSKTPDAPTADPDALRHA